MKRMAILGLAAAFLVLPCGMAYSGEWTSKIPDTQRVGPKFGDHLKSNKPTETPSDKKPKHGKKKGTGSTIGL